MMKEFKSADRYANTNENNNSSTLFKNGETPSTSSHNVRGSNAASLSYTNSSGSISNSNSTACDALLAPSALYANLTDSIDTNGDGAHPAADTYNSDSSSLAAAPLHPPDIITNGSTRYPSNTSTKQKKKSSNKNKLVSD